MMHSDSAHDWAIVLAGGSGTRLAPLTRGEDGAHVPKQYCSLRGGRSLLGDAIARASRAISPHRVLVVVNDEHRRFWEPELVDLPPENIVVQPANRGTAAGVLLPLLSILERDALAHVALFPSDHHVAQERLLVATMRRALANSHRFPGPIELLAVDPDSDESDYGWIVPGHAWGDTQTVKLFVEKPGAQRAAELRRRGALWNSFLLVARAISLVGLYQLRLPDLLGPFLLRRPHADAAAAAELYASLPNRDFSRDLLADSMPYLRLRVVPACGWTDLGTPERVADCLRQQPAPALAARSDLRLRQPYVLAAGM